MIFIVCNKCRGFNHRMGGSIYFGKDPTRLVCRSGVSTSRWNMNSPPWIMTELKVKKTV